MDEDDNCKQIDSIFLDGKDRPMEKANLDDFKLFIERFTILFPCLDLIRESVDTTKTCFSVYDVMLESLYQEISGIQNEVASLEEKLEFELGVYERLKSICLSLTIDEEYFHILNNGVFTDTDDLAKMEKSLDALGIFLKDSYTLKIIKEKSAEIQSIERKFFKRFIVFLSKLFVKSESTGELRVHRAFYEIMSKYKFIYKFCQRHDGFYRALCDAYVKQSKSLYMQEFNGHLNRIAELITDNQALAFSIDSLIRTYASLLECEWNFLKLMSIDSDVSEIFNSVDIMISEFLDLFFKKSSFCVLVSIYPFCSEEYKTKLGSLYDTLRNKYKLLEELYIVKLKGSSPNTDYSVTINFLQSAGIDEEVTQRISKIMYDKLSNKSNYKDVNTGIKNVQILYSIDDENKEKALESAQKNCIPLILETAFNYEESEISKLLSMVDTKKPGAEKTAAFIKATLLENCDEKKRSDLAKMFTQPSQQ